MKELAAVLRDLVREGRAPGVLATLVSVAGSSYRRPGARLLLTAEGRRLGSISGGCLEEDVLVRAQRVAVTGQGELITYDTSAENDLVWGVGLGCHGVVQILLERLPQKPTWLEVLSANLALRRPTPLAVVWRAADPAALGTHLAADLTSAAKPSPDSTAEIFFDTIAPPPALTIFGAGDDAMPLSRLVKELGWHLTIADPRAAFATSDRFPLADKIIVAPANELVGRAPLDSESLAVVMTHHYVHDRPILAELLQRPLAYAGLLGPRKRAGQILDDLGHSISADQRARLHAPVGLDLGAETPEEVALSILAEMCSVLRQRNGRPLRERMRPIHD